MSLTISQPPRVEFGKITHDFSPRISLARSRLSPIPRIDSPVSSLRVSATTDNNTNNNNRDNMSTPHRGLPPPSSMTLPDPGRPPPSLSLSQPLGALPTPPHQWHGQEDSMRNWLAAKAEEDKRKQEEEKTKQESYKLEQRRVEQSMLRESLQAGVPPHMVPMIYAGVGGSNVANISAELLQQYAAQLQVAQQQHHHQSQTSPELRREPRALGQSAASYGIAPSQHQQVVPSQPSEQPQQPGPLQTTFSVYQGRAQPASTPRSATHKSLPRLTTNEMYVHQPPQHGSGSAHPLQQSQTVHDQVTSSPIFFHHYIPPGESKSNLPQTPASRGEPHSAHPGSHLSESDYKESPRKRKAQGPHQPAPPPSAGPQYISPSFSSASYPSTRKGGHRRSRSNNSAQDSAESRRDADTSRTSQPDSGNLFEGAQHRRSSPSDQSKEGAPPTQTDREYTEQPGWRSTRR